MREKKWTAGPYTYSRKGHICDSNGRTVEASGLAISCGYRDEGDECFANSHLFAAAPDLVEALEALLDDYVTDSVNYLVNKEGYGEAEARNEVEQWPEVIKSRAALAKAYGATE